MSRNSEKITIINPRSQLPPLEHSPMAPRFDSLEGKKVYIVSLTWPYTFQFNEEMFSLLSERYPATTFVLRKKHGAYAEDDPELWNEIQEQKAGAILGVGHCSTCAPAVVAHCTSLEKRGVPAVPVHTDVFAPLVKMYAQLAGKPYIQNVFVPMPVSRMSAAKCREYLEGNDPVTGKPVIKEIIDGLTGPLRAEQKINGTTERPVSRLLGPETEDNLHRFLLENGFTDCLPVTLPTLERVEEMLKATSHRADELVGEMRAGYESLSYTVEKVAANAVMAGARPEYFPVILAMAASGVACIASSTNNFARMIVINGPIRKEISMNSGIGALSPLNHANAVIGRAGSLLSISQGGGQMGKTYWANQGNNLNYNHVTFAENEEALPAGWKPFHVQKGFNADESTVSFFHGWGMWSWKNTFEQQKHKAILKMASWIGPFGAGTGYGLLLDPLVAESLVEEGFPTKESLSEYVHKNTLYTIEEYWQYHSTETIRAAAEQGVEPNATLLKQPPETLINRFSDPRHVSVLVVGGRTNDFWQAGDWKPLGTFSIDEWR